MGNQIITASGVESTPNYLSNKIQKYVDENSKNNKTEDEETHIKELSLTSETLTNVPSELLTAKHILTALNLSYNKITSLPSFFKEFTKFQKLTMKGNRLNQFPRGLNNLPESIHVLDLSSNRISCHELPKQLFVSLPQLQHLILSNNPKLRPEIPDQLVHNRDEFPGLSSLRHVELKNVDLDPFPYNLFKACSSLRHVDMTSCKQIVEKDQKNNPIRLNNPIEAVELSELYIRDCNISHVSYKVFKTMHNLRKLDLSANSLVELEVPGGLSSPLRNSLEVLLLQNNKLQDLPKNFDSLEKLRKLNLSQNQITSESLKDSQDKWVQLTQLEELNLSGNRLDSFPDEIGSIPSLTHLDLNSNRIHGDLSQQASEDEWSYIHSTLLVLNLSSNNIEKVPSSLSLFTSLFALDISRNNLTHVPSLIKLKNLGQFDASFNKLTSIPEFAPQSPLTTISLFKNRITKLESDSHLFSLDQLTALDLRYNFVSEIPSEIQELSSLVDCLVDYNDLETLPISYLGKLRYLKMISCSGCPINDADVDSLREHLQERHINKEISIICQNRMPNEILPFDEEQKLHPIYLGSYQHASSRAVVRKLQIQSILTVGCGLEPRFHDSIEYKIVDIEDVQEASIDSHFDECISFIHEKRRKGPILIHCRAGVSRSATVTIAYIMAFRQMDYEIAYNFVRSRRREICPNSGFIEQLAQFNKQRTQYRLV
eukprot:gb/GECH01010135.1/.p1 GENE.gb/GECH01010135.1/~~gb/GECH01010135.1/.p1  ORF type:complete len:713 (+),score=140.54 gb/GECH01010135.1/:1-2139(+)